MLRIFVFLHKILLSQRKKKVFSAPVSISEVIQKKGFGFLSFLCDDRGEGEHWGNEKFGV